MTVYNFKLLFKWWPCQTIDSFRSVRTKLIIHRISAWDTHAHLPLTISERRPHKMRGAATFVDMIPHSMFNTIRNLYNPPGKYLMNLSTIHPHRSLHLPIGFDIPYCTTYPHVPTGSNSDFLVLD